MTVREPNKIKSKMNSIDSFSISRKAYSATKIAEVDYVHASCDYKNQRRISCASASSYSGSERIRNSRHFKNLQSDESEEHLKTAETSKKKLFLYASQILSKLKKISRKFDDSQETVTSENYEKTINTSARHLKVSLKNINFQYGLLKRLLEERSILLLKEESRTCVKQTQKLVSDLKLLYTNEIIKLTTMPIKSYNRFIDSSVISISILEKLFKKVNYICDLHSSLRNNYHSIINFFHVEFDMELNERLLKINKFQNHLYSEMFYWTHKVLEIFILKLCLADPDSVSPEFLHHVLEICESFNLLFCDKKQISFVHLKNSYTILFSSYMQSDYEAVLLDFILQYLSHFEAKVAAEKIIQYFIHECKNSGFSALKEQCNEWDKRYNYVPNSNTSDYYSASPTVVEENVPYTHSLTNGSCNFESVFLSFIQRNQSLVLKFLYSIICLDGAAPSRSKNEAAENHCDSANNAWNLPHSGYKNQSYLCLEERYWLRFWEKVLSFCLKIILEVPCHQYGNAAAGVFLLWPQSYQNILFKMLKCFAENKDIPTSGLNVIRRMLHSLLVYTIHVSWDKNMSSALSKIHGQHCIPTPVADNKIRTRIGNILCSSLESVEISFLNDVSISRNLYLQIFYAFEVTLDCFLYLINIKTRASVSSFDISTFLLLCCSDCVYAMKMIDEKQLCTFFTKSGQIGHFPSSENVKNSITRQIESLSGYVSEAPLVIQGVISKFARNIYRHQVKKNFPYFFKQDSSFELENSYSSMSELLNSFTDIINHIHDGVHIVSAIMSAVASSILSLLHSMKYNISLKKIQTVKEILFQFLKWMDQINIEKSDCEKIKEMVCCRRLLCIIHILESSLPETMYFHWFNNKVSPIVTDLNPEINMILTEEEQLQWRMLCQRKLFSCP